jgi:hypothetical protein
MRQFPDIGIPARYQEFFWLAAKFSENISVIVSALSSGSFIASDAAPRSELANGGARSSARRSCLSPRLQIASWCARFEPRAMRDHGMLQNETLGLIGKIGCAMLCLITVP